MIADVMHLKTGDKNTGKNTQTTQLCKVKLWEMKLKEWNRELREMRSNIESLTEG